MTDLISVGIAGVRGYKGTETARLVARHPRFRVAMVASDAMAGSRLSDIDPDLVRDGEAQAVGYNDTVSAAVDAGVQLVFLATRPALCARLAAQLREAGIRVIDLSGAHCIKDPEQHVDSYGFFREAAAVAESAVYGLPEWTAREDIARAGLIANPTAYATGVLLALGPLARAGLLEPGSAVVDVKQAASAAGRTARISLLLSELQGNIYATKVDRHPHTPEILEELARVTGPGYKLTLAGHIVPIARGMLATCYLRVTGVDEPRAAAEKVSAALRAAYEREPFVRVAARAEAVQLRSVVGTNRCVIGATADPAGDRVVVIAAIDNMLKGAAGQAMQNANLMFGIEETTALQLGTGGQP